MNLTEQSLGIGTKLAVITALLSCVAFIFSGNAYRAHVQESTLLELQKKTVVSARGQARALENELQKFTLLPLVLSEYPEVYETLRSMESSRIVELNNKLASLAERTGAAYIYVVDNSGLTIASSNYADQESFVGRNYEFRPYFKIAMETGMSNYFAKGERTGKAGLFLARRIDLNGQNLGVIVVKVEFEEVIDLWSAPNATTFVTNNDDIIIFSSNPVLNYSTLGQLKDTRRKEILASMQFGSEDLPIAPIKLKPDLMGTDSQGRKIQAAVLDIPELNWRIYRTENIAPALQTADVRIFLRLLVIGLFVLGAILFLLWRLSLERRRAKATNFLKSEVSRQTKELFDANRQLELEMKKRQQINERFRIAREDLAQANRLGSIGAISASVAHEINQPVAAIKAFAENSIKLLNRKDHTRAEENIGSIVELTSKIGSITNELRRYARRGTQAIGPISLGDVVDGVELLIGERINAAKVDFTTNGVDPSSLMVKAGRVRLEQVLVNVIQNALDAIEGEANPKIDMQIDDGEKHVSITVSDNGSGIDGAIQSEVFTPFFTEKPGGLGIGLGIAKDIMNEFGGSIDIVPSSLGGAAFKIHVLKI